MHLDVLLSISAAGYLLLGVFLIASKRAVGSVPIGTLFCVIGVWVFGGAIELMSTSFFIFSIGRTGHFIGTALLPIAVYVSFREFIGSDTPARTILLLIIIPIVSVTLAATNQFHEFMWYLPAANEAGEFLTRPHAWGPWFLFVHAPFSYAVITAAIISLVLHSAEVASAHRRGLFLLITACIGPLIATGAYDLGYGSNTTSFVPIVFAALLPAYAWLVFGERLIEFTPLAYETVFQNMQDPVVVVDDQCRIIGLNHGAEYLLDIAESDALRAPLEQVFKEDATGVFAALSTGKPQKMMTSTGRFLHVQVSPIAKSGRSASSGRVLMFRDVSDVEKAQREVRESERLMRSLIDHSVNGIVRLHWVHDEEHGGKVLRCIFANAAAGRFLATKPDALVDLDADEVVRLAATGMGDDEIESVLRQFRKRSKTGERIDTELLQQHRDARRWLRMICEPLGDDIAATFIDVTDTKAKVQRMESIALLDPLTGVLNRRGFEQNATERLSASDDDATGALLFIDLNEFKQINDRCGHEIGDELLTIAADRLRKSLRSLDIIGRPGGDEFVALVPDVTAKVADKLANRLARALEEPYEIGAEKLECAASIGLALYPENASTLTGLLREADQAMYRAKARCRGATDISQRDLLEKAV